MVPAARDCLDAALHLMCRDAALPSAFKPNADARAAVELELSQLSAPLLGTQSTTTGCRLSASPDALDLHREQGLVQLAANERQFSPLFVCARRIW